MGKFGLLKKKINKKLRSQGITILRVNAICSGLHVHLIIAMLLRLGLCCLYTLQPLYNTVRYKMILDITRFKDGSQKCIDYIEK